MAGHRGMIGRKSRRVSGLLCTTFARPDPATDSHKATSPAGAADTKNPPAGEGFCPSFEGLSILPGKRAERTAAGAGMPPRYAEAPRQDVHDTVECSIGSEGADPVLISHVRIITT